jgi:hypothetical protein
LLEQKVENKRNAVNDAFEAGKKYAQKDAEKNVLTKKGALEVFVELLRK